MKFAFLILMVAGFTAAEDRSPMRPSLQVETDMPSANLVGIDIDAAERFLVVACVDMTARVWELSTGRLVRILRPQSEEPYERLLSVAISPDGATVALGGSDQRIYLFDRSTGDPKRTIAGLPDRVNHLSYSKGGHYLIAALGGISRDGGETGEIRIYRTSDGQELARDPSYGSETLWAEFDRNGRILTASRDGFVRLYGSDFNLKKKRAPNGKCDQTDLRDKPLESVPRALARSGRLQGRERWMLGSLRSTRGNCPSSVRASPDGQWLAVGFEDSLEVDILSAADLSFRYVLSVPEGYSRSLSMVGWSSDGRIIYAGSGWNIVAWPADRRGKPAELARLSSTVIGIVALSSTRMLVASAREIGLLFPHESLNAPRFQRAQREHDRHQIDPRALLSIDTTWVWHHARDADGPGRLRVSADGSTVEFEWERLIDFVWRKNTARFSFQDRRLSIDPPPDRSLSTPRTEGLKLAAVDSDTPLLDGRALPLEPLERSEAVAISSSADHFLLATDRYLRWFDSSGRQKWSVPVPMFSHNVNLTQDGRYAVAALHDSTIRWYAADDGREVVALLVHNDGLRWIAWTPDGFYDCSPGADQLIGYSINQGAGRASEFVKAAQLSDLFYRSDLISRALQPGGTEAIRAARERIGDISAVLKGGLPPDLELLSPAESETSGDFVLRIRVKTRGGGAGRVVYRIDGVEIEGRPVDIRLPGRDLLNRTFDLGPGRHQVSATIYNAKNQLESRPVIAVVNVARAEQAPALFVVAAGVTHYRDRALDEGVKYAASDAQAVIRQLEQQGEGLFREVNPYPLLNEKATKDNLDKTIADVASRIQPGDVFVLYLAGHGTALDGDYYFIPWDVRYTSEGALRQQSLNQEAIRKLLAQIPAKKTLLLLDTCSSGAFSTGRALGEKAAIDRLAKITGRATLAAAATDQMALEGYNGHGVFTYAVLDALSKAANPQGLVEVTTLADYVTDLVPKITSERWHYEQIPMWIFHGQTFPIARKRSP
ncbi:MAG: caspase family protein [Bryobacteraceae bacterium]